MIRVTLDGLVKRYDGVAVVDQASLEVLPGELTYLLGPPGAGKTTLARVVAGLEPLDAGEIFFDDRLIHPLPPQRRKVGLLFQQDALWPQMTIAENVGYPLKLEGMNRRERRERVAEALGAMRIDSLADKRPEALSTLQRQRASLARALVARPELLILDDPAARLETRVRNDFREEIRRLHAETEITMLVLTADPREALATADRLAVMDLGKIVQVGLPHQVYNRPADAFVARLLGPTNLLQGQIEAVDPRGEVVVRTPIGRLIGKTSGGPPSPGTAVTVSIRPEALAMTASIPVGSNRFPTTIERLVFLGELRQVHLRGPGDWPVVALSLQSQSQNLREGQSLTLSVPPDHVVVLHGKYAVPKS